MVSTESVALKEKLWIIHETWLQFREINYEFYLSIDFNINQMKNFESMTWISDRFGIEFEWIGKIS